MHIGVCASFNCTVSIYMCLMCICMYMCQQIKTSCLNRSNGHYITVNKHPPVEYEHPLLLMKVMPMSILVVQMRVCSHVNLSHLQQEDLEVVWRGLVSVEGCVASIPLFPSQAPPLLAEEAEVAVGRGWGTGRFRHSRRTRAGRNLRD